MDRIIKIILAGLLFGCLANMPYGYYQLVRFLAMAGFLVLAFDKRLKRDILGTNYILLAILFQPLIKISLGRPLWNAVDVEVGVFLILSLFTIDKSINQDEK